MWWKQQENQNQKWGPEEIVAESYDKTLMDKGVASYVQREWFLEIVSISGETL